MALSKNSKDLLQSMNNIQYSQFVMNREGNTGTLSKLSRITECFNNITTYITTRANSVFSIQDAERTMMIVIRNIEKDNDHIKSFLITIAESSETFMIEEIIQHEKPIKRIVVEFDKSKL
jgi:hypothetical protein